MDLLYVDKTRCLSFHHGPCNANYLFNVSLTQFIANNDRQLSDCMVTKINCFSDLTNNNYWEKYHHMAFHIAKGVIFLSFRPAYW